MIDIYDDLEDYEELNNYEQLKCENQELKLKLDQCKTAYSKLQQEILQDFDKLAAEHDILRQNFSSLLKTARAEVERKTDAITHINAEKDKLFLSLMKDSTNKVNPRQRRKSRIRKLSGSPVEIGDLTLGEKDDQLGRNQSPSNGHQTLTQTKPKIKAASSGYKEANQHDADRGNKENEVETKPEHTVENVRPSSIRNRRKSMPALRHELTKFSSSEEDGNRSDTTQLGLKTRSQTKRRKKSFKDKHVRQSRYDVHESYRKEERNEAKLRERRGRSSYGRIRESRHKSRGSYRELEDYDYREKNDRHVSPSYDKYHRHKSRERRSYRDNERDQGSSNFEVYRLNHNEKPKKTHRDKRAENVEHYSGRNVDPYYNRPDDQHKQSKNKTEKDDRNFDSNEQRYEKHEHSIDSYSLNSNKELAEKDELDKLKIPQETVNIEIPNLCDKSKKYKIPKIKPEKNKQVLNLRKNEKSNAIDKCNATSNETLDKQDDLDKSVGVHQERPNNAVDLNAPIICVLAEKRHDLNKIVEEHNTTSVENPDYEIDSHKLTHRERLAKKHDYDLDRNFEAHLTSERLHDFDTNVPICDESPTEELVSRRSRPITVFDRRMTRLIAKQSQQKVLVDIEEPVSKRRRISSYRQADEVYCHENVTLEKASIEFGHRFGLGSCQSPDDILADNVTASESMREIMNTAETKLEDPRYTSNRYVTVGDSTSKIRLSVSSTHVHMYKLSWPLDIGNTGHQTPEHTAEAKSLERNREPNNEHSNQNKSYKCSQAINPIETKIEVLMPNDNNMLNDSIESGEIKDIYSDLITTTEPNELTEQTAKQQASPNFGVQRKDDISHSYQLSDTEEMVSTPCDISRKYEIRKMRSDIVNALPNKDVSMPSEELLKLSSTNYGNIHSQHPVGPNTEFSTSDVLKEPENLKTRLGYKLDVPQLQDSPMPLAELFKPSTTDDTANNKQHIETLVNNQPGYSSETSNNHKIPKKNKVEKIPNAPQNIEPQIFDDNQITGPHTVDIKPKKCDKVVTSTKSSAEKIKHNKSDARKQKEHKNLQSHIIATPAKKLLVQGDLELSDEDSENCVLHSQNTQENLKSSLKNDAVKGSRKNTTILKSKESEHKRKENSKTTDINAKLSDLFGETSLITPEDLEIPSEKVKENFADYVLSPICEFSQIAVNADCNPLQVHKEKTNKSEKIQTRSGKAKKDSDYDKKTQQKDDKKSRKVSKCTTDKDTEKSEKHIIPKKRKNDVEKTKKASTEFDAIKVIPETNDKTASMSSCKQTPLTVSENNEPIILTDTPKLTQIMVTKIADDSMKALATSTPARVPEIKSTTSITLRENSSSDSVDRSTGNDTSAQSMTNVSQRNTNENAPDVQVFFTRRKRKRVSK